jgi:hypothetical protein
MRQHGVFKMRSKQMLMGAAVIGCIAAATMSGAYAQQGTTPNDKLHAGNGQLSTGGRTNGAPQQGTDMNTQPDESAAGNQMSTSGQNNTQNKKVHQKQEQATNADAADANKGGTATRMRNHGKDYAGGHRNGYVGATNTYGRNWRGEYGHVAAGNRFNHGWRGERWTSREHGYGANYGYRSRGLYAYAPGYGYHRRYYAYEPGYHRAYTPGYRYRYRARAYYNYAPGYNVGYRTGVYYNNAPGVAASYSVSPYYGWGPGFGLGLGLGPYYGWGPGLNVAYAGGPYYGWGPDLGIGIGLGPLGIGIW